MAIDNEVELLKKINHQHVVKYFGTFMHPRDMQCILLEFCEVFKIYFYFYQEFFNKVSSFFIHRLETCDVLLVKSLLRVKNVQQNNIYITIKSN